MTVEEVLILVMSPVVFIGFAGTLAWVSQVAPGVDRKQRSAPAPAKAPTG